ncbi:tetratricopeptide repeat protein [Lacticaseibacillus nasuensis]|uniref:Tetratricopeptide repeat family protein n=1 Tax=Lacticaseibacillus nasuensis JCM 17158 TaxID=1291734 RepID=A0A0R1JPN1_9LACO|nr:tetratricopeptide repeat protein [Lacticaseibacillus nasuensis]KRK73381.1 tetratricopeptide repeat family protein [Lacticaseibacillus nasuensis JCM 17158]
MSYSEQMLAALEQGDMAKARDAFTQVLAHDDDETRYNLAEELYALGFTGQAQRLYEELLGKYPDQDDIKTVLADIAVSNGDADKALKYLADIGPDSDAYGQALMTAADVYQTQGLYEVSEQKLLTAAQAFPDEPVITFALGELYFAWGHDAQAASAYSQLLAADETEFAGVNVQARYASSLANLGQYEEAIAAFEAVGDSKLAPSEAFQLGGLYLQTGASERAVAVLKQVIDRDASFASAYLPLAQAQEAQGDQAAALATVQDGLQVDDTNPTLFTLGANLALKLEQPEVARRYLQKALAIDPENQTVMLEWSNFLLATHDDEANIAFLAAIDQSGDIDPQIYWNLAKSHDRLDHVKAARENYLLAFRAFQNSPDFLHDIIDFFQSTGSTAELKAALTRYLALVPSDSDMQDRLDELNREN